MGLHTLRKNISVIPQMSFFFKSTLRKNIDSFEDASDEEIWIVLDDSNLKQKVSKMDKKL